MDPEVVAGAPAIYSEAERLAFTELVREGEEVGEEVLERNIGNAKSLVFLRVAGDLVGVAALKNPLASYRDRIGESSGYRLAAEAFPYELGYIFVVPEARQKGLSRVLVEKAIVEAEGRGVFDCANR